MNTLVLYDDAQAREFAPFSLTRPLGEMRAGIALIRHRWERALAATAQRALSAAHLADFAEAEAPPLGASAPDAELAAGTVVANTRCAVALTSGSDAGAAADIWSCGGRVAAVRLPRPVPVSEFASGETPLDAYASRSAGAGRVELPGRWLEQPWDFIGALAVQLREDIAAVGPALPLAGAPDAAVIGDHPVYVEHGAVIEPMVCFDVTAGPVLVCRGATVRAFTRLVGPCAVGRGATILGDRVAGCAIGEGSVIRGEMSETIVLGQSNKGHDGFVGHSYLGRWVNLGAGTITSNLKNTYGPVQLWTPAGMRETGLTKLGTLFGDHVKTAIGTRLTTGTVVGAGANVFGGPAVPKYVPPFSWGVGEGATTYQLDAFLVTAERVMTRRGIVLGDAARRQLAAAHARAMAARRGTDA